MCNKDITIKKRKKKNQMTFANRKDVLSCSSDIWNAVFVRIIAYVANSVMRGFLLLHENETLFSYLMLW